MRRGPSRRDQCESWIARAGFVGQDCETTKGVVAAQRSRGGDMGERGHPARQLSLLVRRGMCVFQSLMF